MADQLTTSDNTGTNDHLSPEDNSFASSVEQTEPFSSVIIIGSPFKEKDGKQTKLPDLHSTEQQPLTYDDVSVELQGLCNPAHEDEPPAGNLTTAETPERSPEEAAACTMAQHSEVVQPCSPTVVTAIVGYFEEGESKSTPTLENPPIHVEEQEETHTVDYSQPAPPYGETVVTAVVEYVQRDDDSRIYITEEERLNVVTTLLASSGDVLPSLPPPVVIPIDDPNGYIHGDLEKSDSCLLEMKILQKSDPGCDSPPGAERCDSQLSTLSDKVDICRICHCEGEENNKLISPCLCSGSLKYLHLACLQKWIKSSDKKACVLCNFDYIMSSKTRPFKEWEKLEMTHNERRKVVCSVTFHVIAITCVIWSLYVLIDRTTEEVHLGTLDWPFWTKLIVVTIGFTGGMIFMYVQCKMYVHLCSRWRSFNKLITIENAPEDPLLRAEAAARIKDKAGEEGGVVNTVALQEIDSV